MLVDSEPIASRVLAELLSLEGYATTPAACHADFQGNSFDNVLRIVGERLGRPVREGFFEHYQKTLEMNPEHGAAKRALESLRKDSP